MIRFDAIRQVMEVVGDEYVICNLGHPSQELCLLKDRPKNFYMLGSMGLASSIGLGIALSTTRKVLVIDGDGSVLMNLGTLATIGANQPQNYVLIIIDNEAYGSTGFQPTFTARGVKLIEIAKACNFPTCFLVNKEEGIAEVVKQCISNNAGPYCVVIKAERGMPENIPLVPYDAISIRDRFMRSIRSEDDTIGQKDTF